MRSSTREAKLLLKQIKSETARDASISPAVFAICGMDKQPLRFWRLVNGVPEACDGPGDISIPERLEKLLWPKRYKIICGGRGSGKTQTAIKILTERGRLSQERVVCFREIMRSISDSVRQEIQDEMTRRNIIFNEYKPTIDAITHKKTKATFKFSGLFGQSVSIKGKSTSTVALIEEAEDTSNSSLDALTPTIRRAGSEIWAIFNPKDESDPIWKRLVAPYHEKMVDGIYEDEHFLIIECHYTHNPWLTPELIMERDTMARNDPDRFMWIWEGKFKRTSDEKILNGKWVIDEFTPGRGWNGPYFGADFGFSQDPSTLTKSWIYENTLYIEYEAGGKGIETDQLGQMYDSITGSDEHTIRADSSRPETISQVRRTKSKNGRTFNIIGDPKLELKDSIAHLRSFDKIVIHKRCKNTIFEANNWKYKCDKLTGDPLPIVLPGNEHWWDAVRYSLYPIAKKRLAPVALSPRGV